MQDRDINSLLKFKQIIQILPVCKATFYNMIQEGIIPPPIKNGRSSFWRYRDILEAIEKLAMGKCE